MNGEHAIHVAEIEADAAKGRVDLAFERGAGAEGDHRYALCRAQPHDLLHLFGGLRKDHRIRRLVADPSQRIAVLLAHRLRGDEAIAEAMAASAAMTVSTALRSRLSSSRASVNTIAAALWRKVAAPPRPVKCCGHVCGLMPAAPWTLHGALHRARNPPELPPAATAETMTSMLERPDPEPAFLAPFVSAVMQVEPGWIDYNGHLNMAYYNVLFDRAVDEAYELLGCGLAYLEAAKHSTFTAEAHIRYLRELHAGDPVRVTFQLLDFDAKRMHYFEQLFHARRRLALGHIREHGAACRHDREEDGAVSATHVARLRTDEGRARAICRFRKAPAAASPCRRKA